MIRSMIRLFSILLLAFSMPVMAGVQVTLETSEGTIKLELNEEKAPLTVANFLSYVDDGFYNGTIFHRVIAGFMIQGGGFTPDMEKKDTNEPVRSEAKNGLQNKPGTIAMARTRDPHSATAQFFINTVNNHFLNEGARGPGYTVFGKVIEGMDVVMKISRQPTAAKGMHRNAPKTDIVIEKAYRTAH